GRARRLSGDPREASTTAGPKVEWCRRTARGASVRPMGVCDSSALVPLLVLEAASVAVRRLVREDAALLVWWGSRVECVSAIARLEREAALTAGAASVAISRLD